MNTKAAAMPARTERPRKRVWWLAAVVGVVSAAAVLAVAELVALTAAKDGSPVLAVGSFVVDIVPRWAKEFAIETFGATDKIFLLGSIGLAVVIAAAVAGVLEYIRTRVGSVILVLTGLLSVAAIVTRAGASPLASLPTILGTVVGVVLLRTMMGRLRRWMRAPSPATSGSQPEAGTSGVDRRRFIIMTVVVAAASTVVGIGSRVVSAATSSLQGIREALKLPTPQSSVAVPPGPTWKFPDSRRCSLRTRTSTGWTPPSPCHRSILQSGV